MASSLFLLLDDIAATLDDVAVMTKVAAKKTAGVLGDDLALNAQQVTGMRPERELPVVWAVAKGSAVNKLILVPAALLLSMFLPALMVPLLIIGGLFLCFEGVEKLLHPFLHPAESAEHLPAAALVDEHFDVVAFEREKIKGAIRTDFILSAEIIVIALDTVANASLTNKISVLVSIAAAMTVGVYGLVAAIVKLDDLGMLLMRRPSQALQALGRGLLAFAPWLLKFLAVAGTLAMFLVGGGLVVHNWPWLHHTIEHLAAQLGGLTVVKVLLEGLAGVIAGGVVLAVVTLIQRMRR